MVHVLKGEVSRLVCLDTAIWSWNSANVPAQENDPHPAWLGQVLDPEQSLDPGFDAAFLARLPQGCSLRRLPRFNHAPGQTPLPCKRMAFCLAHEQSLISLQNHCAHTHRNLGRPTG